MSSDTPVFEGPDFGAEDDLVPDEVEEAVDEPLADTANRAASGTAQAVLEHVVRSIVDDPEAVSVSSTTVRGGMRFELHVAPDDMGRIIGKRGRVAQALRALVRAAAARDGTDATVDIVD